MSNFVVKFVKLYSSEIHLYTYVILVIQSFCMYFLFCFYWKNTKNILGTKRKIINPHLIDEMIPPCQKYQNNFLAFQAVLIHLLWILFGFLANLLWIQVNWHYILEKSYQNNVLGFNSFFYKQRHYIFWKSKSKDRAIISWVLWI